MKVLIIKSYIEIRDQISIIMNWCDNEKRVTQWEHLRQKSDGVLVHDRIVKLYEVLCIVSSLTLNTLITTNTPNDYLYLRIINLFGIMCSIFCIGISLTFIALIQIIAPSDVIFFINTIRNYLNFPMICTIISFACMNVSIILLFDETCIIIFTPVSVVMFVALLCIYGRIRREVFAL